MKKIMLLTGALLFLVDGCTSTSSPTSFYFDYPYQPNPGKRHWEKVNANTWIEKYPNGTESTFKFVGTMKVKGTQGTLLVKVAGEEKETWTPNDGRFQVFIPDKGSSKMHTYFRHKRGEEWDQWRDLAEMKDLR